MDLIDIKNNMTKRILEFSIPSIIAMIMTSLITVADGYFIGNYIGKEGIAAINFGLPIIYLFLALGLMISVGGIAIAGIAFGAGEMQKCKSVFNQTMLTVTISTLLTAIVTALCLTSLTNILKMDELCSLYFKQYYSILLFGLPVMVINSSLAMFIRGEGKPQLYMKINMLNVVLNIFLDWLFVTKFNFGIKGIAFASLISVYCALILMLIYFIKTAKVYTFLPLRLWKFSKDVFKHTIVNGFSEFIGEMSSSIAMFCYNLVIMKYIGLDGVAAFSIVGYVSYIFSMVLIGFGQGLVPLVSFAYGAKDYSTAVSLRKRTNLFVFVCGFVTMVFMILFAEKYTSLFVSNVEVINLVKQGMWIFVLCFLVCGINTITSFYFTSIGKAFESAIISSSRGLVILLICIFVLPALFGMTGVWLVAPITEGLTILITIFFICKTKSK